MAGVRNVHVVPDLPHGWEIHHGAGVLSRHRTQEEAVAAGRRIAKRKRVDLVTWGVDGKIHSKDTYGNETAAPDKEH